MKSIAWFGRIFGHVHAKPSREIQPRLESLEAREVLSGFVTGVQLFAQVGTVTSTTKPTATVENKQFNSTATATASISINPIISNNIFQVNINDSARITSGTTADVTKKAEAQSQFTYPILSASRPFTVSGYGNGIGNFGYYEVTGKQANGLNYNSGQKLILNPYNSSFTLPPLTVPAGNYTLKMVSAAAVSQQRGSGTFAYTVAGSVNYTLTPINTRSAVTATYQDILQRNPSPTALASQATELSQGLSPVAEAKSLITSNEFTSEHPTNSQFVDALYQDVLGVSNPSGSDESFWTSLLDSNRVSRGQVALAFLDAPGSFINSLGQTTS